MDIVFGKTEFDRWLVLGEDANSKFLLCRCRCGTERRVNKKNLKAGVTRSCGCYDEERRKTHGMCGTQTYMAWSCMRSRVRNHRKYIEDGITVCKEWKYFENFLSDMGECPPGKYSVDRIDNSKGYEPGNCRWASRSEQQRNKTTNRMITYDGRTQVASAWAEEYGMTLGTLTNRLNRGWSVVRALTTPVGLGRGRGTLQTKDRVLEFRGRQQTLEQWAAEFGLNMSTMIQRVWDEWSMERIAATPQGRRGGHKAYEDRKARQAVASVPDRVS